MKNKKKQNDLITDGHSVRSQKNIKILIAFGTRPEAIKMCPLVRELRTRKGVQTVVCSTGQHRELMSGALSAFDVNPDVELDVMTDSQGLVDLTGKILYGMRDVLAKHRPDVVVVHGDTATALATALCAFYMGIDVAHVEAGLRSRDIASPYPEEFNRRTVSLMARYHFAPTAYAAENLLHEGVEASKIVITGNTVVDAFKYTLREEYTHPILSSVVSGEKLMLFTAHRRESYGEALENIFEAVRRIATERTDIKIIYPVHPCPQVREKAYSMLKNIPNIILLPPLDVVDCHNILAHCHIVLTDSGGLQEESAAMGIPVLVLRNVTERQEGILSGNSRLAGTNTEQICATVRELLNSEAMLEEMRGGRELYGDGNASCRIADVLSTKKRKNKGKL